jgi:hypothetical protein
LYARIYIGTRLGFVSFEIEFKACRNLGYIMVSLGRFATLYRSTLFQIVIVGLVAFCEPGIWTALNNLGAGGNAKVSLRKESAHKSFTSQLTPRSAISQQCRECTHVRLDVCWLFHRRRSQQQAHCQMDIVHRRGFLHTLRGRSLLQQPIRERMVLASRSWVLWYRSVAAVGE